MLIAASVMNSVSGWPGTSMTKTWLIRRSVLSPVAEAVTSRISSSVCRLPFIRSSPLPSRISVTARAAAWLWPRRRFRPVRSMPCSAATPRIFVSGPTSTGSIRPTAAASTAPRSEVSSQGWATIVTAGVPSRAEAIERSWIGPASWLRHSRLRARDALRPPPARGTKVARLGLEAEQRGLQPEAVR